MVECVYASQSFMKDSIHAQKVKALPHEIVSDTVYKKMSATKAPQGILTVMKQPVYEKDSIFAAGDKGLYLVLNEIQDPGNLGTMLRTAEGAGVSGIIMDQGCVDLFNPKVIRSTMGAIFRVPFLVTQDLPALLDEMRGRGITTVAAHLQGKQNYTKESYLGPTAILIGNEGNGLRDEISEKADVKVLIPMEGKLESLNAAVSAALLMYEVHRQREN